MNDLLDRYFGLLERRLIVMRQLVRELETGQAAIVGLSLSEIVAHTAQQEALCRELRCLENALLLLHLQLWPRPAGTNSSGNPVPPSIPVAPAVRPRWIAIWAELNEVEQQIRHLARVHAGLLRRAGRSLGIFLNLLNRGAGTYVPPPVASSPVELQPSGVRFGE
jgi:hypothetical protein